MGLNLVRLLDADLTHLKDLPTIETELQLRKLCSLIGLSDPTGEPWRALYLGNASVQFDVEHFLKIEPLLKSIDWRCRLLIIDGVELPEPNKTKALWYVLTQLVPGLIIILVSPPEWAKPYGHVHIDGISSVGRYIHMVK